VSRRLPTIAVAIALALAAAACGQKSGVAGSADDGGSSESGGGAGGETGGGETGGTETLPTIPEGGDGGTATTAAGEEPAPTTAAEVPGREPGPNDTSGVTDDEIVIGIHAPVTGASPIPQTSFDVGKDIYWKFLAATAPDALSGRTVRVVFRDDQFNPNQAVQVCREMVEAEGAFLLIGGGGADQITACAAYADEAGVPYLSAGVNEEGLADLSSYFAVSLTYNQQNPLIVARIQELGFTKVGVVVTDTPSFADAHDGFIAAAEEAGLEIVTDDQISKTASEAETLAEAQKLKSAGAEAVFLLSSPTVFLGMANGARSQTYEPLFIGPGVTSGLNAVTTFGCPAVSAAEFFSPFPQLDVIDELDPDFRAAYAQVGEGAEADDVGLGLWSVNKVVAQMLEATGPELGRAAFMDTIEQGDAFDTGVYGPVTFSPDDHFGGSAAHLLKADCSAQPFHYVTEQRFVEAGAS
jgi:ABC-type branched-subunit amino acid transport system substrate-binding protein